MSGGSSKLQRLAEQKGQQDWDKTWSSFRKRWVDEQKDTNFLGSWFVQLKFLGWLAILHLSSIVPFWLIRPLKLSTGQNPKRSSTLILRRVASLKPMSDFCFATSSDRIKPMQHGFLEASFSHPPAFCAAQKAWGRCYPNLELLWGPQFLSHGVSLISSISPYSSDEDSLFTYPLVIQHS